MKSSIFTALAIFAIVSGQAQTASSGEVVSAELLTYVAPVYPASAVAGSVHSATLTARLGTDGKLHDLHPIYPLSEIGFEQSAVDAASQWVYKPYTRGGQPFEMDTVVSVVFSSQHLAPPPRTRVSQSLTPWLLIKKVAPISPDTDANGTVVISAVIGRDGTVTGPQVISGPKLLQAAALEAARQWTYKPYLLNGTPTEIQTQLTFKF